MAPDHQESEIGQQEGSQVDWQPAVFLDAQTIIEHYSDREESALEVAYKCAGKMVRVKRPIHRADQAEKHGEHEMVILHPGDISRIIGKKCERSPWVCLDCILTD
jgi:hypothetical protein